MLKLIYDRKKVATKTKPAAVEICISAGGKRKYISTGVRLFPKEWKDGSVTGRNDWIEVNQQLQVLLKKCREIIVSMMDEGNLDLDSVPHLLNLKTNAQLTFLEFAKECAERRSKSLREGTRKRYKVVLNFLEDWKGLVSFADVTERTIIKMDEYLKDKGLIESTRYNYHKLVKLFIRDANNEGYLKTNPYGQVKFKRIKDKGILHHLEPAEFHRFETCKIPVKHLDKVRDLFVFQTYTMLSYSDLEKFDIKKCVEVDGKLVYKAKRTKTGQEFTIVMLQPALDILQKYNGKVPMVSNQKYNDYVKRAVMYADIDKPVTSHWARHTGATLMLNEGDMPMHIVQHILGHASIRETERTYAKVLDKTIIDSMSSYKSKNRSKNPKTTPKPIQNESKMNPRVQEDEPKVVRLWA